jgi:hypothetical protein
MFMFIYPKYLRTTYMDNIGEQQMHHQIINICGIEHTLTEVIEKSGHLKYIGGVKKTVFTRNFRTARKLQQL